MKIKAVVEKRLYGTIEVEITDEALKNVSPLTAKKRINKAVEKALEDDPHIDYDDTEPAVYDGVYTIVEESKGNPSYLTNKRPRAEITLWFAKKPANENVYVGGIELKKNGKMYRFDFDGYDGIYAEDPYKELVLFLRDCSEIPEETTLGDLAGARVKSLFLQGEEGMCVDGQYLTDVELTIYDSYDCSGESVTFTKEAFLGADFGEYYDLKEV